MKTKTQLYIIATGLILFVFTATNSFSQSWYENWERHPQNPIMDGPVNWTNNFWGPVIIYEDDTYKMWFTSWEGAREIGYAESDDGYSWEIHQAPVIIAGTGNDWDYHKIAGVVLRIDDTLRMWYSGIYSDWSAYRLGYAWSLDGKSWQVNEEPVLEGASFPAMHYDGTIFHMYYSSGWKEDINYATSEDGITWIKSTENNPVIERGAEGTWNDEWVLPDGLIMHNDTLHMFLSGWDGTTNDYFFRIGYAWSVDFINWSVNDDYVFDVVAGGWESQGVSAGTILFEDDKYKMWYEGDGTSTDVAIGYAEIEMPTTCLPEGILFETQAQIDSFQINYPNCTEIEGDVNINGEDITNLNGLSNLTSIKGSATIGGIFGNEALTSLTGLENLISIGGWFRINGNIKLADLTALNNLTTIGEDLWIAGNDSLTSLNGLEKIDTIRGDLGIGSGFWILGGNKRLTSLEGLNNLTYIDGSLSIESNWILTDLTALQNLISINGNLKIGSAPAGVAGGNTYLTDLWGLHNINPGSIDTIVIIYNTLLSDCYTQSICDWLVSPNGTVEIHDNATGCNSPEEVEQACDSVSSVNESTIIQRISIHPNPFSTFTTIEYELQHPSNIQITIYNQFGKQLEVIQQNQSAGKQQVVWNAEGLPSGVYFCVLKTESGMETMKMIKMK